MVSSIASRLSFLGEKAGLLDHFSFQLERVCPGDLRHDLLRRSRRRQHNRRSGVYSCLTRRVDATSLAVNCHTIQRNLPVLLRRDRHRNEIARVLGAIAPAQRQLRVIFSAGRDAAQVYAKLLSSNGALRNQVLHEGRAIVLRDRGEGHADNAVGVELSESHGSRDRYEGLIGRSEAGDGHIVDIVDA